MVGKGVWECGAKDLREENNEVKKKKGKAGDRTTGSFQILYSVGSITSIFLFT